MKQFNQMLQFLPFYRTQLHFVALWEKQPNIEIQCIPEPAMSVCVPWRFMKRHVGNPSNGPATKNCYYGPYFIILVNIVLLFSKKYLDFCGLKWQNSPSPSGHQTIKCFYFILTYQYITFVSLYSLKWPKLFSYLPDGTTWW